MWYIDLIVICVVVLFTVRGYFKGFFGASNGLFGRFGGMITSVAISSLLSLLMKKLGLVNFLKDCYTNLLVEKLNVIFFAGKIANILAMLTVIFGCYIICKWTIKCLFKSVHKFFSSIRNMSPLFKRIDGTIGVFVGLSVSCLLILGTFGFVYLLENFGYVDGISQTLNQCKMSSAIYENNPIIQLFSSTPLAEQVVRLVR